MSLISVATKIKESNYCMLVLLVVSETWCFELGVGYVSKNFIYKVRYLLLCGSHRLLFTSSVGLYLCGIF